MEILTLSNSLEQINNASCANIPCNRSSYGRFLHLFAGVVFGWKCKIQLLVALHLTELEAKQFFFSLVKTLCYRLLLQSVRMLDGKPTFAHVENKSTIDIVNSQRITPRIKHIGILI